MDIRLTKIDAKIVLLCQSVPRRPLELFKQFEGRVSYSYLNQRLSVLHALGVLVRRNLRWRGRNASWYTVSDKKYVKMAEDVLREDTE